MTFPFNSIKVSVRQISHELLTQKAAHKLPRHRSNVLLAISFLASFSPVEREERKKAANDNVSTTGKCQVKDSHLDVSLSIRRINKKLEFERIISVRIVNGDWDERNSFQMQNWLNSPLDISKKLILRIQRNSQRNSKKLSSQIKVSWLNQLEWDAS